jgi:hypothetical protein
VLGALRPKCDVCDGECGDREIGGCEGWDTGGWDSLRGFGGTVAFRSGSRSEGCVVCVEGHRELRLCRLGTSHSAMKVI